MNFTKDLTNTQLQNLIDETREDANLFSTFQNKFVQHNQALRELYRRGVEEVRND